MTAVSNTVFTAAQFNTHVRDNLNETAPAKATTAGTMFIASGANSIVERVPSTAAVTTSESTGGTGYGNLATPGPAVTVTTGTKAIVFDLEGNPLGSSYNEYGCTYPRPNWVEQDAALVVDSRHADTAGGRAHVRCC